MDRIDRIGSNKTDFDQMDQIRPISTEMDLSGLNQTKIGVN